jgi:hypothetical protein
MLERILDRWATLGNEKSLRAILEHLRRVMSLFGYDLSDAKSSFRILTGRRESTCDVCNNQNGLSTERPSNGRKTAAVQRGRP